jgi:hypothetical protein
MLGLGNSIGEYRAFQPGDVSNLALWLKNYVDIAVSQWDDQSGNDNHVAQGTSGDQPAVVDGGLDFEQSEDDHMTLTTRIDLNADTGFTLGLVMKPESYDSTQNCWLSDSNSEFFEFQTNGKIRLKTIGTGAATSVLTYTGTPFAAGSKFSLVLTRAALATSEDGGGILATYKNNATLTPSSILANSGAGQIDTLGRRDQGNDRAFDGIIYEVVVYQKELEGSELTNLNEYLAAIAKL